MATASRPRRTGTGEYAPPDAFYAARKSLDVLEQATAPLSAVETARHFTRAKSDVVAELLETLASLGQARRTDDGRFAA